MLSNGLNGNMYSSVVRKGKKRKINFPRKQAPSLLINFT